MDMDIRLALFPVSVLLLAACASSGTDAADSASPEPSASAGYTQRASVMDGIYQLSADGRTLSVNVKVGGGCSETGEATAEAAESGDEVVLSVAVQRTQPAFQPTGPCPAHLVFKEVAVQLASPLGDRDVIDGSTGTPLKRRE